MSDPHRRLLKIALAIAVSVFLVEFVIFGPDYYRYRVTLTVHTPEGDRSGSSVVELMVKRSGFFPVHLWRLSMKNIYGVAPIVDLGPRGWLLAALTANDMEQPDWASNTIYRKTGPVDLKEVFYDVEAKDYYWPPWGTRIVPRFYPQLVWMHAGGTDPTEVRAVLPERLGEIIGGGVTYGSFEIERTTDPVVERLPNAPRWINELRTPRRYRSNNTNPYGFSIGIGAAESARPPKPD